MPIRCKNLIWLFHKLKCHPISNKTFRSNKTLELDQFIIKFLQKSSKKTVSFVQPQTYPSSCQSKRHILNNATHAANDREISSPQKSPEADAGLRRNGAVSGGISDRQLNSRLFRAQCRDNCFSIWTQTIHRSKFQMEQNSEQKTPDLGECSKKPQTPLKM